MRIFFFNSSGFGSQGDVGHKVCHGHQEYALQPPNYM